MRHKVEEKQILVSRVPTEENLAYPFTKALTRPKHEYHIEAIGVRNIKNVLNVLVVRLMY